MPRTSRLIVPGYPHHIIQRGHNRQTVFVADEDYLYYLENLRDWKVKLGCRIYAYCLMTNHIHLIIDPGQDVDNLGKLMKRLAGQSERGQIFILDKPGQIFKNQNSLNKIGR